MHRLALLISASAAAIAAPAYAEQSPEEMRVELQELRGRVQSLESMVERLAQDQSQTAAQASEASQTAIAAQTTAQQTAETVAAAPSISFGAAARARDASGWSFNPFGRIQYDFAQVGRPDGFVDRGLGSSNELRRGRIGVEGDIPGGFGYKLELDFADNDVAITDAIISYETGDIEFTVGQHNGFQSLEELTSSRFTSFMERAAFTDAFNFERRVGVSAGYAAGDVRFNAGVFTDDIDALTSDENNSYSFDGRLVFSPEIGDTRLHFGASAHWRDLQGQPGARYRQRPFVHTTDTRFIDTGTLPVTDETSFGLEAAVISGRFHAVAEGHWLTAELPSASNPTYFGGYIEGGVFLTDDSRGYSGGKFNRTRPNNPVGEGGIGAVQLNVRYDYLDLSDAGIIGGTQNLVGASLIWTPIDHARLSLNYAHIEYDDAPLAGLPRPDFGIDVFGMRAELDF